MDQEIAKKIGLLKHQIISPVLMESERNQMEYFRKAETMEFDIPGVGPRKIKASTMKTWLNHYRRFGFQALTPKTRNDKGVSRKMKKEEWVEVKSLRNEHLNLPITLFYEKCVEEELLGHPPICYSSLVRFLKVENLFTKRESSPRKRYEMDRFGELWVGDFCHGPHVKDGRRLRKAILLAIIDDHSRYIVGAQFAFAESTIEVECIFKEAILSFGIPDRLYVDNGPSFSSNYLAHACAQINIGLVHSKPYDSPSRGKIERFFRTMRESFLIKYEQETMTLSELNNEFAIWLRKNYHQKQHSSIQVRPLDRLQASTEKYPLKRLSKEQLDEYFMASFKRGVKKDATVSIDAIIYEVPAAYIGNEIEIRNVQGEKNYYLYEDNRKICQIMPVDSRANAKTYRPTPRDNALSFHQ
jgi:transposase InsO family protein